MAKSNSTPQAWKLSTGREFFEIVVDGIATRWEYDVTELKLIAEDLERACGMRKDDSPDVSRPTPEFLRAFAEAMDRMGCSGCTIDAAFRIYNVTNAKFVAMFRELQDQITNIVKG